MTRGGDIRRSPAATWRAAPRLAPGERRSARDRILATAADLFYKEGVRGVGVDRIVTEAEVAKATFYRHFPSKDNLVGSWLAMPHVRFIEWMGPEADRRADTPTDAVIEFFKILAEWFHNDEFRGCAYINSSCEFPQPDHPTRLALADHEAAITAWIAERLDAAGLDDPQGLANSLFVIVAGSLVAGVAHPAIGDNAVVSAETLIAAATD